MPHSFFKSRIMVRLVGLIPGCADITHTTVFAAVLQHHREAKEALSVSIIQRHIRTVLWIVKMRCNCKSLKGCFFLCVCCHFYVYFKCTVSWRMFSVVRKIHRKLNTSVSNTCTTWLATF